jgi:hypothetical protein
MHPDLYEQLMAFADGHEPKLGEIYIVNICKYCGREYDAYEKDEFLYVCQGCVSKEKKFREPYNEYDDIIFN